MKSHGKRRMISSCTEPSGCRNDERVLRVHAYGPAGAAPKTCGSVTGKKFFRCYFFFFYCDGPLMTGRMRADRAQGFFQDPIGAQLVPFPGTPLMLNFSPPV